MKLLICCFLFIGLGLSPALMFGQLSKGKELFYKREYAQSEAIFKQVLKTPTLATEQQEATFWLGMCAENTSSYPRAIAYYQRLDTTAHTLQRWRLMAKGQLVICYLRTQDKTKAESMLSRLNNENVPIKEKGFIERINGVYYYETNNYQKALGYYQRAVTLFETEKDSLSLLSAYLNLANTYKLIGKTPQALMYYTLSQKLHERMGAVSSLSQCYESIGMIFMEQREFMKAEMYVQKAYQLDIKLGDKYAQGYDLISLASIEVEQQNYPTALSNLQKAVPVFEQYKDLRSEAYCYQLEAKIRQSTHQYAQAIEVHHKALELYKRVNYQDGVILCLERLSFCYEQLGNNALALSTLKQRNALKDTLFNGEKEKIVQQLTFQFDTERKDALLTKQQLELTQKQQRITQISLVGVIIVLVLGLFFVLYRWQQRRKIRTMESTFEQTAQQLQSFNYSVSHDLRHPILVAQNALNNVKSKELDTSQALQLKQAEQSLKNMNEIIEAMLTLSAIERDALTLKTVDTKELVADVLEEFITDADIRIENLPKMRADVRQLRQVFTNLISNAIKYSSHNPTPQIQIIGYEEANQIKIEIKDNGLGFDEQFGSKLFQLFGRLHPEVNGTGVGLVIVKRIIEKHRGKVWAMGKKGQGAVFGFELPK